MEGNRKKRVPPALLSARRGMPPALAAMALTDAVDVDDILTGSAAFNGSDVQPLDPSASEAILDYVDAIDTAGDVIDAFDQVNDAMDAADVLETVIDIIF